MKLLFILIHFYFFILPSLTAQTNSKYLFAYKGDTFSIKLSEEEIKQSQLKRNLILKKVGNEKRKKLRENILGKIRLTQNDTLYTVHIIDYFDKYLIGWLTTQNKISKRRTQVTSMHYRRIMYNEIIYVESDGHRNILPKLTTSIVGAFTGLGMIIRATKKHNFSPTYFSLGAGIIYFSSKLLDSVATKKFYINSDITKHFYDGFHAKYDHQLNTWTIKVETLE